MPLDNKKEQERAELHRVIWNIANDLRGSVDGWDFKQYVLGMLFYRYISENLTNYLNNRMRELGENAFDYTLLSDEQAENARKEMVKDKGFFILPSELFANVCARASQDDNLNETLETAFRNIEESAVGAESEDDFKGLFDDIDVNSKKLGDTVAKRNDKLVKLLQGVQGMHLGNYQDNTIDAFGDAYEFLMGFMPYENPWTCCRTSRFGERNSGTDAPLHGLILSDAFSVKPCTAAFIRDME